MFDGLKDLKASVSKTFSVDDKNVKVEGTFSADEVAVTVKITNQTIGDVFRWTMFTEKDRERVECRVFGLTVSTCNLEPKLPPCKDCPLSR